MGARHRVPCHWCTFLLIGWLMLWKWGSVQATNHLESSRSLSSALNHGQAFLEQHMACNWLSYCETSLALAALIPGLGVYLAWWNKMPDSSANIKPPEFLRVGCIETLKWAPVHRCGIQFVFFLSYFMSIFPYELPAMLLLGLTSNAEATAIHKLNNRLPITWGQIPKINLYSVSLLVVLFLRLFSMLLWGKKFISNNQTL